MANFLRYVRGGCSEVAEGGEVAEVAGVAECSAGSLRAGAAEDVEQNSVKISSEEAESQTAARKPQNDSIQYFLGCKRAPDDVCPITSVRGASTASLSALRIWETDAETLWTAVAGETQPELRVLALGAAENATEALKSSCASQRPAAGPDSAAPTPNLSKDAANSGKKAENGDQRPVLALCAAEGLCYAHLDYHALGAGAARGALVELFRLLERAYPGAVPRVNCVDSLDRTNAALAAYLCVDAAESPGARANWERGVANLESDVGNSGNCAAIAQSV